MDECGGTTVPAWLVILARVGDMLAPAWVWPPLAGQLAAWAVRAGPRLAPKSLDIFPSMLKVATVQSIS